METNPNPIKPFLYSFFFKLALPTVVHKKSWWDSLHPLLFWRNAEGKEVFAGGTKLHHNFWSSKERLEALSILWRKPLCFGTYHHLIGRGWWWDKTEDVNVASDMYFWTHARFTCGQTGQCVELKRYPHKWYNFEQSMMAISIRRAVFRTFCFAVAWLINVMLAQFVLLAWRANVIAGTITGFRAQLPWPMSSDSKNSVWCLLWSEMFSLGSTDLKLCVQCALLPVATSAQLPLRQWQV